MDLVKTLNKIGEDVEKDLLKYELSDEEVQLIESAIVEMKQRIYEELKNKI
jgi:hypothetical protein